MECHALTVSQRFDEAGWLGDPTTLEHVVALDVNCAHAAGEERLVDNLVGVEDGEGVAFESLDDCLDRSGLRARMLVNDH
jgi:hypothetical protein